MHIFLQPIGGVPFELEVPQPISVEDLEKRLREERKFPDGVYRFVYNGAILETNLDTVEDYGIVIVAVFQRPKPQVDHFAARAVDIMNHNGTLAAYNPENVFYEHPDECAEFGRVITPRGPRYIAENMIVDRYRMAFRYAGAQLPVVLNFCGIHERRPPPTIDEIELGIQMMSNEQTSAFNRLLQRGLDRRSTYVLFEQCNFNEELATQGFPETNT